MAYSKSVRVDVALLVVLAVHVVFTVWVGRLVQMDEVFFKAAGREWAATGRFAAPECTGFLHLEPPCEEIWFAQPPVYMFLFGVFARLLGFGPWQCILYDELIHVLQAWLTYRLARRIENGILPPGVCFLIGAVMLLMGTVGRSDELANCFGLAGLLPLVAGPITVRAVIVSAVCLGLSAGTSVAAGGMIGIMAVSVIVLHSPKLRMSFDKVINSPAEPDGDAVAVPVHRPSLIEDWRLKLGYVALWGVTSALTLVATLAPILIPHPDALHQYLGHVNYQYNQREASLSWLMSFFVFVGAYYIIYTGLLLLVGILCYFWNRDRKADVRWGELWVGPIGALVFLALNFPYKYTYLWYVGPWLLVAAAANMRALLPYLGPIRSRVLIMATLAAATTGAAPLLRHQIIYLGLPVDQHFEHNLAIVREKVPPGSAVITNDFWWSLGSDCRVYDIGFGNPEPEEVDFYVMTQSDTGEPSPPNMSIRYVASLEPPRSTGPQTIRPYMREWVANHFVIVHDNLNRQPVVIAGVPMKDSSYGFGSLILAQMGPRKKEYEASPEYLAAEKPAD